MKKFIRSILSVSVFFMALSASAQTQSPSGLTLLREDFNQPTLDTTIWNVDLPSTEPASASIINGYFLKHGIGPGAGHDLLSRQSFGPGTRFEFRASIPWSRLSCVGIGITRITSNFQFGTCWNNSSSGELVVAMAPDPDVNTGTTSVPLASDHLYTFAIDYGKDGIVRFYADGKFIAKSTTPASEMVQFYVGVPYDNGLELKIDWVKITTLQ